MGKLAGCSKGQVASSRTGIGRGGGRLLLALGGVLLMGAQTRALGQACFTWVDRTTAGPSPRYRHGMAYDSARGVTVLFGGDDPSFKGDTWEWDGTSWTLRSSSGPSARQGHAMAYDSARGVTVLFGGYGGALNGDTWEWDGTSWTLRSSSGPSPRVRHAMAYDSVRGVTVLFGGNEGGGIYDGDTWEWDGTSWTLRSSSGPSPRFGHAMAYDSARGVTVLFGGWDGIYDGDTWEWDGTSWTLRSSSGPSPRRHHAMAYDSARGVTVLFGGWNGSWDGETWEWGGTSWALRSSSGPSPRSDQAMAYDRARGVTVLFGGYDGSYDGETWEWTGCLIQASLDIKPGSCPNPLNRRSQGVLPVAIVGTQDLDVSTIDPNSILLSREGIEGGVGPVEVTIQDVATAFEGEACDCHDLGADGIGDLLLNFSTQDVVEGLDLNSLSPGEEVLLTVTANVVDGTSLTGSDCVWLVPPVELKIKHNSRGYVELDPAPVDPNLSRYPSGTVVTLTARPLEGNRFKHWKIYDPNYPGDGSHTSIDSNNPITIVMSADREVTASFACGVGGIEGALPLLMVFGMLGLFALIRRKR